MPPPAGLSDPEPRRRPRGQRPPQPGLGTGAARGRRLGSSPAWRQHVWNSVLWPCTVLWTTCLALLSLLTRLRATAVMPITLAVRAVPLYRIGLILLLGVAILYAPAATWLHRQHTSESVRTPAAAAAVTITHITHHILPPATCQPPASASTSTTTTPTAADSSDGPYIREACLIHQRIQAFAASPPGGLSFHEFLNGDIYTHHADDGSSTPPSFVGGHHHHHHRDLDETARSHPGQERRIAAKICAACTEGPKTKFVAQDEGERTVVIRETVAEWEERMALCNRIGLLVGDGKAMEVYGRVFRVDEEEGGVGAGASEDGGEERGLAGERVKAARRRRIEEVCRVWW